MMINVFKWFKKKNIDVEHDDNGAAAFWKEADEQALNCGMEKMSRRHYAWVRGIALDIAIEGTQNIKKLDESSIKSIRELFVHVHQRYPEKTLEEFKRVLAVEMSICVSYWEDGTDVDLASKGLELLADEFFIKLR